MYSSSEIRQFVRRVLFELWPISIVVCRFLPLCHLLSVAMSQDSAVATQL